MKRLSIVIFSLILVFAYGTRLYSLAKNADKYDIVTVELGEKVDLSGEYFFKQTNIDMNGYSVTVNKSYTKTLEEMVKEYGYNMTEHDSSIAYFYIVELSFVNESSNNPHEYSGIDLFEFVLKSIDNYTLFHDNAYITLNPDFTDFTFKLGTKGEEFKRILPFPVYYSNYQNVNCLIENSPSILAGTWPKMILMNTN